MALAPSKAEIRLAMAELVRADETMTVGDRRDVRKVTDWVEETKTRWQGCSCEFDEVIVTIYYDTWSGRSSDYWEYQGSFAELIDALQTAVEQY